MHLNSKLLFQKYATSYFQSGQKVLEVGPIHYPTHYRNVIKEEQLEWHTLDLADKYEVKPNQNPLHITTLEPYDYPIEDETYDIVVSGQVMEHVQSIWRWIKELKRITKKGGHIILICPVSWDYHEAPVDCWRIYPEGMKTLMDENQLKIELCLFESLEKELLPAKAMTYPGNSRMNLNGKMPRLFNLMKQLHQVPVLRTLVREISVSYDTICISQK